MEEEELSKKCRQGDNSARKELYEQHAGRLLALCMRYIGDKESARDVMHDGFVRLFLSFDKFKWRGEGSLRAWMDRVMINEALQWLRRNVASRDSIPIDDVQEAISEPTEAEVDRIPEKVLLQFIDELPPGYRAVFNLYTFEEKSHKEIGELLHINEKSSSSQLYHAKTILAKRIKEWMFNNR